MPPSSATDTATWKTTSAFLSVSQRESDDRVSPPDGALFAMRMLGTTPSGDAYTFVEIDRMLHDAGFGWGKDRSWCETGTAWRKRKSGTVRVTDPDATAKKT